jgi:hypothetical protein
MSIDIGVPGGDQDRPGFHVQRDSHGLSIAAGTLRSSGVMFGVANDEGGLSINAFPVVQPATASGFTVYTFTGTAAFLVHPTSVTADILVIGGGGSGGGGAHGGGGGAGGFVDEHAFVISAAEQGAGIVTVGAGGAAVAATDTAGNRGESSSFGPFTAYGGGYGSREGGVNHYLPSDGASGGGAWPYEELVDERGGILYYRGHGGLAVHGDQGHSGGDSTGTTAFYNHTSGGGGGANWPGYGGSAPNGGLGRPCDIAGWGPYWSEPDLHDLGRIIPWFCGGGAGKERYNLWSYSDGNPGYGGGGACGNPGAPNTGGGGGGHGWYGADTPEGELSGMAPGREGGSGVVIIRIRTADERLVQYPVPTGRDQQGALTYPEHVHVTHITEEEEHTDRRGDESVVYWGWPSGGFDTYGFDQL